MHPSPIHLNKHPSPIHLNKHPSPIHLNKHPSPIHLNKHPSPIHLNMHPSPIHLPEQAFLTSTNPLFIHGNKPPSVSILLTKHLVCCTLCKVCSHNTSDYSFVPHNSLQPFTPTLGGVVSRL